MSKKVQGLVGSDSNKPMHKSIAIWLISLVGISWAGISMYLINQSLAHLSPCTPFHSPNCLNNLMINMKYPFSILTATITLVGFWALIFKSNQTTKQIELTINHNTFNNFIAHKKSFAELLAGIETQFNCELYNINSLYDEIFPLNTPTNICFDGDSEYVEGIENRYKALLVKFAEKALDIIKLDPRIDPEIGLVVSNVEDFIHIDKQMKELMKLIEHNVIEIKMTELKRVSYHETDEQGECITHTKVPADLLNMLFAVSCLIEKLSKFSNIYHDDRLLMIPMELVEAIKIYNISSTTLIDANR